MGLSNDQRLGIAKHHYFANHTGPYPGAMPLQPSKIGCSVEEDGTVTLRNSFRVLAKMRVDDTGQVEELDFNPYDEREEDEGDGWRWLRWADDLIHSAALMGFQRTSRSPDFVFNVDEMPLHLYKSCVTVGTISLARLAYENFFPSRRGFWAVDGKTGICVLYNNNPYRDPTLRDGETKRIRKAMKELGVEEIGYVTYPPDGEDKDHTYAMIVIADEKQREGLISAVQKAVVFTKELIYKRKSA